jgi:hypothetical protein
MGIKIKMGDRSQHIPAGEYLAKVTIIKEGQFAKRRTLEFYFEIADGPHRETMIRGFVNAHYESFSSHTKLRQWILAITKDAYESQDEVDLDIFLNKVLRVTVESKISKKTKNQFSNITNILGMVEDLG